MSGCTTTNPWIPAGDASFFEKILCVTPALCVMCILEDFVVQQVLLTVTHAVLF